MSYLNKILYILCISSAIYAEMYDVVALTAGLGTTYVLNIAGKQVKIKQSSSIVNSELEDMSVIGGLLTSLGIKYATSKGDKKKELYASQIRFFVVFSAAYQCITSKAFQSTLKEIPIVKTLTCDHCETVCAACKKNKLGFTAALVVLTQELCRTW